MELTHASFFSGVGGLDLGLERAGWRTVSFSEIDPYASAVLAERWPGVPNLGDITSLRAEPAGRVANDAGHVSADDRRRQAGGGLPSGVADATLWSGGFPCQDLSVAGKRAGFTGQRSILAFTFLDLVERHRPPAILLENVPGLLSSNGGKDFGRLLGEVGELGYWWAYRILDAQFFGVPQRRRRVFICALDASRGFGADSAAAVLSVGTRCDGHSAASDEAGQGTTRSVVGSLDTALGHHGGGWPAQSVASGHVIADGQHGSSPDSGGVRAADGLAGRLDDRPLAYRKATRSHYEGDWERWEADQLADTIDANGHTARTATAIVQALDTKRGGVDDNEAQAGHLVPVWASTQERHPQRGRGLPDVPRRSRLGTAVAESDVGLLPLGLDSHRYRCCGNGVVSNVSEWIGWRLRRAVEGVAA